MSEPTLAALREAGADRHDPVRFHYLEVLERRLASQPESVRAQLTRLEAAIRAYVQRQAEITSSNAVSTAQSNASNIPLAHAAPLTRLNRYIQDRTHSQVAEGDADEPSAAQTLASTRRFSTVWAKIAADQQVAQAIHAAPDNAGPLNSHRLMLRALALMRGLSPDYLGHFLAQMDTLLWLDQLNQQTTLKQGKSKSDVKSRRVK